LIHNTALTLSQPSDEYKAMMEDMLEKHKDEKIKWTPSQEVRARYGR
jgi:hypothetical protein